MVRSTSWALTDGQSLLQWIAQRVPMAGSVGVVSLRPIVHTNHSLKGKIMASTLTTDVTFTVLGRECIRREVSPNFFTVDPVDGGEFTDAEYEEHCRLSFVALNERLERRREANRPAFLK